LPAARRGSGSFAPMRPAKLGTPYT